MAKPTLLFVSTMFLWPVDTGARIRTTQILRGLRGGRFETTLASPATASQASRWGREVGQLADHWHHWPVAERGPGFALARLRHLPGQLPVPVRTDCSAAGSRLVRDLLARKPDVVVVDFPHAMVLMPEQRTGTPEVVFTHNVEAEIFARHRDVARDPVRRLIWENQRRKMAAYERAVLRRADAVIAVSERDAAAFRSAYGVGQVGVIPTGVDLEFFEYRPPAATANVVFTGSMDWMANIDGVEFLLREVWPIVLRSVPEARMTVVGRNPPSALVEEARQRGFAWTFTGWVDETRSWVWDSAAFVIPLRVGGGTRLKVWEAMAMGSPVVSTRIGVEGLPVEDGKHCLLADDPAGFAAALVRVLREAALRQSLSATARAHVEASFSFQRAARVFEDICAGATAGGSH
ncbi:MAG: glycosyltransferase [Gammaproteobacteria bacterium]|nr:glycosyltransferase [Gammaproteobacteria bacterium]